MKPIFTHAALPSLLAGAMLAGACGPAFAQLAPNDNLHAPQNSLALMPGAQPGSEYPTHGNRQAGEMPVGPTDPRGQLANGHPNNAEAGGYGAPLAGVRTGGQGGAGM
ncbi:hypothetical protein [Paraburkholderia sp. J76]|uniref:hypothetical protein n=1 Tax=Paraburkholderia sp. J76 TaxID=2805439 RepID=UPI002ABD603A|nr:hypothetical protein [Paraburkholderia sp. J76]